MQKQRPKYWMAGLLLFILISSMFGTVLIYAQYEQKRHVVSGGGHSSLDAARKYRNTGTIGQGSPVGCLTNSKYTNCGGFWGGGMSKAPVFYNLSVVTDAGTGSGTVIGPGIDCPGDCSEAYKEGRKIELEGIADRDSGPVCWKLDSPDDPECHLDLPSILRDITVYAMFESCLWPADVVYVTPENGAADQPLDVDLAWEAAERAESYTVFFGATSLPLVLSGKAETTYDPGTLIEGVTYAWRIDAVNICGTLQGPMWTFMVTNNHSPEITSIPPVMVNRTYQYDVEATDQDDDVLSFSLANAPDGMTIDTLTGLIVWTASPEQVGTYTATVTVEDGRGGTTSQPIPLIVTEEMFDEDPPVVSLSVTPETILLGQSVTITTTAADNLRIAAFQLTANDVEIATTPGTITYTPSAAGVYSMTATAIDGGGNTAAANGVFWVKGETAAIPLYEGFNAEHGTSEADPKVLIFVPGAMTAVADIPVPPGITSVFHFSESADIHFEYAHTATSELQIVLAPSVSAALLTETPYDSVTPAILANVTLEAWTTGKAITAADTVVFFTTEGRYFKLAPVAIDAAAWTVEVQYAELAE